MHETRIEVSFGDCDPAGIAFYPNHLRWFDQAFQRFLASLGLDQACIATRWGAIGTGLIDCGARFRAPVTYGETLTLTLTIEGWTDKTVRLAYRGMVGSRLAVEGHEVRGLFFREDRGLRAAPVAPLRRFVETAIATQMGVDSHHDR